MRTQRVFPVAVGLLMTACATVPAGPSVMVLPGNGKNFEQFQADDAVCRQWAAQQTGTTTKQAATEIPMARGSSPPPYVGHPPASPPPPPPPPPGAPPPPPPGPMR